MCSKGVISTKGFLLLIILPVIQLSYAQSSSLDSLRSLIQGSKDDSSRVMLYYTYGDALESAIPDSAMWYYKKARNLSEALGYKRGMASYASHAVVILNNRGRFREALDISKEALRLFEELGDPKELAVAYLNVGSEWHYLSDFQTATDYYLKAQSIAKSLNDLRLQRITGNNLASIFINLKEYEKGKQYAENSLVIAKQLENDYAISSSTYNIATAELHLKEYNKALKHYSEIEKIGLKTDDYIVLLDGWLGMADVFNATNSHSKALQFYHKVVAFSKEKEAPEYEMYAYMGMSDVFIKTNRFNEAKKIIFQGIELAQRLGSDYERKDLLLKASELLEKKGEFKEALVYRKKFEILNDSIIGDKSRSNINLLEAKFESEYKESRITKLEAEKKIAQLSIQQKNTLNYVLIGTSIIILLFSLLLYRNYVHKQRIQRQRISRLEKEKQLAATEAVLKGEERERTRLAKDLHDGLGGMLSGIKYSFQTMRGNLTMTPENQQTFERSMDMLNSSIKEMRRVAHNMMPESLIKFGLDTALKDFCAEINTSGALKINYQSIGMSKVKLDQIIAVTLYRIVQELINNTIKHAAATIAIVQLTKTDALLSLTVEDDGKGFDSESLEHTRGMGWTNINNRIDFLKGKLNLISEKGKGTSVHVELKI